MVETALRPASIGVRCELVWTATFLRRRATTDTSLKSSRLAELECEISPGYDVRQKIMAFDNSGTKAVACDHPRKGWIYYFSLPPLDKQYIVGKLSISEAKICSFIRMGQRIKNYSSWNFLQERKNSFDWALWCASRGINNFSLPQLHEPYSLG